MNKLAGGIRKITDRGVRINGHYHELGQLKGSLMPLEKRLKKKSQQYFTVWLRRSFGQHLVITMLSNRETGLGGIGWRQITVLGFPAQVRLIFLGDA